MSSLQNTFELILPRSYFTNVLDTNKKFNTLKLAVPITVVNGIYMNFIFNTIVI